ncbi:MAG: L,D-transpeptidase [Hormoscilla sp.]
MKGLSKVYLGLIAIVLLGGQQQTCAQEAIIQPSLPPLGGPGRFLPQTAQIRLMIKLADRRVYVYRGQELKTSYPIAIGRAGWETPTGEFAVRQMLKNPTWEHPLTGEIVPPGPDNPLGNRWIGFWTDGTNAIGFHGTPKEETVGRAASHGCIRMFNEDILALFSLVKVGTPVIVQP